MAENTINVRLTQRERGRLLSFRATAERCRRKMQADPSSVRVQDWARKIRDMEHAEQALLLVAQLREVAPKQAPKLRAGDVVLTPGGTE